MPLKSQTKKIDGHEYKITQLDAMRGLCLSVRIMGDVAPALARAADAIADIDDLSKADLAVIGPLFEALFVKITPDEIRAITIEMLSGHGDAKRAATRDGVSIDPQGSNAFDFDMAGQVTTIIKLLAFAFEVNFGDFFDYVRPLFASLRAQAKARRASESTSLAA